MKRTSRWERSPGWPLQGLGTAVLTAATGVALWLPGWVLAHVSDAVARLG